MKTVRLLPLLAVSAVCLFMLKFAGLLLGDGYVLSGSAPAGAQAEQPQPAPAAAPQQAQTRQPAPERTGEAGKAPVPPKRETRAETAAAAPDAAQPEGAGEAGKAEARQASAKPAAAGARPAPTPASADAPVGAEKDILISLSERRKELDARARELELRENLLKVAEERVETRIKELKAIEQSIETQLTKRDEARDAEYAKLVSLYSRMKPKDAARIFERMEVGVLASLIRRMNARTVSPILAEMDPAVAKRVTMEMASTEKGQNAPLQSLPKITGKNPG